MSDSLATHVMISFSWLNLEGVADAIEVHILEVLVTAEDDVFGRRFSKFSTLGAVEDIFGELYVRYGCVLLEHSRGIQS